jgi:hypothetical protein
MGWDLDLIYEKSIIQMYSINQDNCILIEYAVKKISKRSVLPQKRQHTFQSHASRPFYEYVRVSLRIILQPSVQTKFIRKI